MDAPPPPEMFSGADLKKAREEFRQLQSLLQKCQNFSKELGSGKANFDELLLCLYTIEKNEMYQFLSKQDPSLKSAVDGLYYNLRKVGGVLRLGLLKEQEEMKEAQESEDAKKLKEQLDKLDKEIEEKGIVEPMELNVDVDPLKRKIEEIEE